MIEIIQDQFENWYAIYNDYVVPCSSSDMAWVITQMWSDYPDPVQIMN